MTKFYLCLGMIASVGCDIPAGPIFANGYVSGVVSGGGGIMEVLTASAVQIAGWLFLSGVVDGLSTGLAG